MKNPTSLSEGCQSTALWSGSFETCPNMGLSWPAAQENIPTTQEAARLQQTGASKTVGVVRYGVGPVRRESNEKRRDLVVRTLEEVSECIHAYACVVNQSLLVSIHITEFSSDS